MGNQRARLAQAEAALAEHPLALAHAQADPKALCDPGLSVFPSHSVPVKPKSRGV